jgi:putative ABC transport system permease protein
MSKLWRDFRFAVRLWTKNPGFTSIAMLTLALGIGATTAIFSVIYSVVLAPLPYPKADQLAMVWSKVNGERQPTSVSDYLDWKRQNTAFQGLGAWNSSRLTLSTSDHPEGVSNTSLTPGLLEMIGEKPWLGRYFLPEEGEVGKEHVVVLVHRFWQTHFGGDPKILGKRIRLNGEMYTVVGVRPPGIVDRQDADMNVPLAFRPQDISREQRAIYVMGRLKNGVSLAEANSNMGVIARQLASAYPQTNQNLSVGVEQLKNDFLDANIRTTLWLLMGAVGFVLLIACVNIANLLLARGSARQKEIALRVSLGASRHRIFAQLLMESMVLALFGGAVGVALGAGVMKAVMAIIPQFTLPSEADPRLNVPVLLFALITTTLAGVLFGCVPAWQASRLDLNETLKEGGRSVTAGRAWVRRMLVAAEFALALTLLAGAGLAIHSFWNLTTVDLGARTDHLLVFGLPIQGNRFSGSEQISIFYSQILQRLEAVPGVSRAGLSTGAPLEGSEFELPFTPSDKPTNDPRNMPTAAVDLVTPGFLDAFGIRVDRGRAFSDQDQAASVHVAMVNETLARRFLSGADPLTQRLSIPQLMPGSDRPGPFMEWQIVGVFHDVHNHDQRRGSQPQIYLPFWQSPTPFAGIAVRTAVSPGSIASGIRQAIWSVDPDLPLNRILTMDEIVDQSLANDRFQMVLYASFAGVALLLAALGIYGVMAFAVAQRTHEIGMRIALGAGRGQVLRLVMKEGVVLALAGLALGLIGAGFVGRAMRGMLFGVGAIDIRAFVVVALTLLASALLACYVPARRAARVDPMVALRYE